MRSSILMAGIILLAASCSKEECENVVESNVVYAPVNVRVSCLSVSVDELPGVTRAVDVADYTGISAIDLAFYADDTEVYKTTQIKGVGDYTFGDFSFNLPIGHYTMVVIARENYNGDVFSLTSPTSASYTSERARETFCSTQSVTVTSAAPLNLTVALKRIMAQLYIQSTDGKSAGVAKIRTTYAGGSKSFNPTTGLSLNDEGFSVTNTPSSAVGSTIKVTNCAFLASDDVTMDITIEALDSEGATLFTKVVEDVPLKRNCQTTLRGAVFSASDSSVSVQVDSAWGQDNTVNF